MSVQAPDPEGSRSEFERRTQATLEQSIAQLDGRTRSRLNQARQRALEAHAARSRSPFARLFGNRGLFAPVGAVAAAAVLAVVLWTGRPGVDAPGIAMGDGVAAVEDLDLLADNDALELARGGDPEFYEWALANSEDDSEAVGT